MATDDLFERARDLSTEERTWSQANAKWGEVIKLRAAASMANAPVAPAKRRFRGRR